MVLEQVGFQKRFVKYPHAVQEAVQQLCMSLGLGNQGLRTWDAPELLAVSGS